MSSAKYEMHGSTAVITLDNPPVNGLGYDLRCGIVAGIDQTSISIGEVTEKTAEMKQTSSRLRELIAYFRFIR